MAVITDENDNLVEVEEVKICIPKSKLNHIFDVAVSIDQIEVPYHSDPLVMANDAISLMRQRASEIAALVGYHE